ncbi:NRDE family protein [Microbacterium sp. CJ88]|uniref:NRDE family protein n=1 Tax=Microbacterium sp. CJ88 TaxID=3445672 RepID=UPI003F65B91B
MCTVIISVPVPGEGAVRLVAVRDEDPERAWDRLGPWWPDAYPGVVGVRDRRAGGAWLAAGDGRLAVLLNRADLSERAPSELVSRGGVVLEAVAGRMPSGDPRTHGFHLVQADATGARVVTWNGVALRTVELPPGVHMIAHDDIDDPDTARIDAWLEEFRAAPLGDGDDWATPWLDILGRSDLGVGDDRAIIRDNRPFGYPTQSLLLCTAVVSDAGVDVRYAELDRPGHWNDVRPA